MRIYVLNKIINDGNNQRQFDLKFVRITNEYQTGCFFDIVNMVLHVETISLLFMYKYQFQTETSWF